MSDRDSVLGSAGLQPTSLPDELSSYVDQVAKLRHDLSENAAEASAQAQVELLSQTLDTFGDLLDFLVQSAIDCKRRYEGLVVLHTTNTVDPATWSGLVPQASTLESIVDLETQYLSRVRWAIGAMSVGLTREEKSRLAIEYPATFGKQGSSSQWC